MNQEKDKLEGFYIVSLILLAIFGYMANSYAYALALNPL
jgi:hypothetical protein